MNNKFKQFIRNNNICFYIVINKCTINRNTGYNIQEHILNGVN